MKRKRVRLWMWLSFHDVMFRLEMLFCRLRGWAIVKAAQCEDWYDPSIQGPEVGTDLEGQ